MYNTELHTIEDFANIAAKVDGKGLIWSSKEEKIFYKINIILIFLNKEVNL